MTITRKRLSSFVLALTASTSFSTMARAQSVPPTIDAPPIRSPIDNNGVNLATGGLQMVDTQLTIGRNDPSGLSHVRYWTGNGWRHGYFMVVTSISGGVMVSIGGQSTTFTLSSGVYTSDQGNGATLTATTSAYTYTAPDGTVITFDRSFSGYIYNGSVQAVATSIVLPTKETITLTYRKSTITIPGGSSVNIATLLSVNSDNGYQLKFTYYSTGSVSMQVTAINNVIDYCDPTALTCSGLTQSWPTVSYSTATSGSNAVESVTDALGRITKYTTNSAKQLVGVRLPGSGVDTKTIGYDANGRVSSVANTTASWGYTWSLSGSTLTATVTDPFMHQRITTSDANKVVLLTDKNENGYTTTYQYDGQGRLTYFVPPEGTISSGTPTAGYVRYDYDGRGNVMTVTRVSKTAGAPANIVTSASYDTTCTYIAKCNKPNSTKDALGNQTDYTYDTTTGNMLTVTSPAPATGGIRPQVRYSYTSLQGYFKNSGGSIVASGQPIQMLTGMSVCRTNAAPACVGTSDETRTTVGYGPQTAGTGNNLLPVSKTVAAGDGSLSAVSSAVYDDIGNPYTTTGPLGSAYTTRYRYDADREQVGVVGPDPDGSGALKNRAIKTTYDGRGLVTRIDQGTVPSQSDADWANFVSLQAKTLSYDSAYRTTAIAIATPTPVALALTQYSYDAVGRLLCATVRMNTATFATLPDACTQSTPGSFGSDRITSYNYSNAGQLLTVVSGYGTPLARNEQSFTYTPNGKVGTTSDAKTNLTSFTYDGFDRPSRTCFQASAATCAGASPADYEQLGYDANGNATSRRLRDGNSITLAYDALNRLTGKTQPSGATNQNYGYSYDLLGNLTAANNSGPAYAITTGFVYDALGRQTSTTSYLNGAAGRTMAMQYDVASQRTRLTWPDGFFVTYDHDTVGEMTAIHENGASIFASYAYDDLGRRGARYYSNGTSTLYGYDQISRLNHLTLSGGANTTDILPSSYNPAGEIGQRSTSNDAYAFTATTGTTGYTSNGLNQYSAVGTTTPTYDARGNTTNTGSAGFTYDLENHLTGNGTVSLYYDALGRLRWDSGPATRFDYDGSNLAAEYDGAGNLLRRYVFGPGIDEAVLWYEGTGTGTKRFLDQNEQGSVVRINDGSGNAIAVNTYDEYGRPGAANQGRFQYTGQAWIADVGLSYYKARMYAPTLGRFMQTDPIGYGDGVNWYNYAHSNPVNGTDSSGKACTNLNKKARVLSGCFNPDTAGDGGSYLGGSVLGDNAFLNYASGVDNAYYAQQAAAQRAGSVYIESVADAGSSSAASDGTAQNKQLQGACSECMLLLLVGGEAIEAGKLFQAGYDALTELIAGAAAPEGAATVEDVISPGGSLIGTPNPGSPGDVQNLPGGDQAANDLFDKLSKFGTPGNKTGYPGPTVDLPNGGFAGYRSGAGSSSGVPAVDVNIPGTYVGKFHFP